MSYSAFGDKESPNPSLIPSELVAADRVDQRLVVTAAHWESRPLTHHADCQRCEQALADVSLCKARALLELYREPTFATPELCAVDCAGGICCYSAHRKL